MTTTDETMRRDIHTWFGLSYSAYLVLERDRLELSGLRPEIEAKLDELTRAFAHIEVPQYRVLLGEWYLLGDMDDEQLKAAGFSINTPNGADTPTAEDEEEMAGREVTYTDGSEEYTGDEYGFVPKPNGALPRDAAIVVSRTLLQSMPESWQYDFVDLLQRAGGVGEEYKVEPGVWIGEEFTPLLRDPVPHYNRGRTHLEPRPEG